MPYANPADQKKYERAWYLKNKEKVAKRSRINERNRRERIYRKVAEYLSIHPCVDCGEDDVLVLEFDHVRGKKLGEIVNMIHRGSSWEDILAEIEKCDVRCANDHRRKTAQRGNHFKFRWVVELAGRVVA